MRQARTVGVPGWLAASALAVVLAGGGVLAGGAWAAVDAPARGKSRTLDQIREQRVLRAGIGIALPWLGQNPKTNQYFGPAVELGERIARILGVKLEML